MILRMWTGWTARRNGDAYERYLREDLFPRLEAEIGDRGYRGYQILRRDTDGESEFITLVWFDALECVTAFAGPGYEEPVISETARALLIRHWARCEHYALADSRLPAPA